jgi:ComF family protein
MWNDFLNLFFPKTCVCCDDVLLVHESHICGLCLQTLPYVEEDENTLLKKLAGRVKIEYAAGFLLFNKKGMSQKILHELKYRQNQDLGIYLGKLMASKLPQPSFLFDCLIPVPLHPQKKQKRGYNQSEMLALGISEEWKVTLETEVLIKTKETNSQTKKGKTSRLENMQDTFGLINPNKIAGKHVVLIDDVATTGATLEACCLCLEKAKPKAISVLVAAVAR